MDAKKKDLRHRVPSLVLYKQSYPKHCTDAPELQEADGWKGRTSGDGNTEDFAAGPAVKTPSFHCKGHGFNSLSRNQNPKCCQHGKCIKKKKKKEISKNLGTLQRS